MSCFFLNFFEDGVTKSSLFGVNYNQIDLGVSVLLAWCVPTTEASNKQEIAVKRISQRTQFKKTLVVLDS